MPQLIATFADFAMVVQDAIHRANRAVVLAFIEQGGMDGRRRLVDEAWRVQQVEHDLSLVGTERSWLSWTGAIDRIALRRFAMSVERCPTDVHGPTCGRRADVRRKLFGGFHQSVPSLSGWFRGMSNISETFF